MTLFVKRIFIGILLIAVILSGYYYFNLQKKLKERYKGFEITEYSLEGKRLKLLVANTEEKREKGLMFYKSLEGVDGMMFVFPEKRLPNFWNKNTFMDLDVYWIDGDKVVGRSFLPSIEKSRDIVSVRSQKLIDKVIEIPSK